MSNPISMEVIGLPEFAAALARLGAVAAAKNLDLAGVAGALPIRNAAAEGAPKKTRTLSRSIHIGRHTELSPGFSSGEGYSDIGGPAPTRNEVELHIGTNLVYAAIHEFGGVITPKKAKALSFEIGGELIFAKSVHIPARPYLRPAFDTNLEKAKSEIAVVLTKLLGEVAR